MPLLELDTPLGILRTNSRLFVHLLQGTERDKAKFGRQFTIKNISQRALKKDLNEKTFDEIC